MLCRRKTSKYTQLTNHWFCFDNKGLFEAKCQQNGLPKNYCSEQHAAAWLEIQYIVHVRLSNFTIGTILGKGFPQAQVQTVYITSVESFYDHLVP